MHHAGSEEVQFLFFAAPVVHLLVLLLAVHGYAVVHLSVHHRIVHVLVTHHWCSFLETICILYIHLVIVHLLIGSVHHVVLTIEHIIVHLIHGRLLSVDSDVLLFISSILDEDSALELLDYLLPHNGLPMANDILLLVLNSRVIGQIGQNDTAVIPLFYEIEESSKGRILRHFQLEGRSAECQALCLLEGHYL